MDPLYLNQLPIRTEGSDYDLRPHLAVLHDPVTGKIHSPEAAAKLASAALALDASLEAQLGQLWHQIFKIAYNNPEHQDKLVSILVDMSHLPDVMTPGDNGQDGPLILHDMQVWRDMPLLGWEIRRHWDECIPLPGSDTVKREAAILKTINVNCFVALLVATDEPVFMADSWFALVTLRIALETPWVLGAEIYEWDDEYESGRLIGAPGRGEPLWKGKRGFSKNRWTLWRRRFGETAKKKDEPEHVKRVVREAELMMKEIEAGDVE
ncbi:hypothetical protein ASPSYDRAFT_82400 [Aspergillus sydowii CBS 593.65]|uniref:Uncharacterized protein n=1 Tax=Aspergillus sydowii CBS 593.65 TaxID=1036612 RepID=A0A1L9T228_9EURO|nr:uncharacterized protein ASPSYDRAFT_82400 [Aspergillus sydowii CBS 593.65]OJJ53486.1 hypothetical protein ASPSYDRAFT_82400 [Aspergillus sydowii CBS 593.65]